MASRPLATRRGFHRWLAAQPAERVFDFTAPPEEHAPTWVAWHCPLAEYLKERYHTELVSVGLTVVQYTIKVGTRVSEHITDPLLNDDIGLIDRTAGKRRRYRNGLKRGYRTDWRDVTVAEVCAVLGIARKEQS